MTFDQIGLKVPEILLPKAGTDMTRWAVIACDQYTSEPEYWQQARQAAGEAPSTLDLVFPEVYLEDADGDRRIAAINAAMEKCLADGTLESQGEGFLLLDRKTSEADSRKGLIVALDLEHYDYSREATSLVRATEGTILDRLPPRIKVRQNAPIELPHIMVLIDDPERTVIEPLFDKELEPAYDFPLMLGGGHLKGWRVSDQELIAQVAQALEALADPDRFAGKYQVEDEPVVLYAMGDGNHSFATAKAIWEELKESASDPDEVMDHPARWALVELVNVHDPGLEFEPIHRVLFDVDAEEMLAGMESYYAGQGASFSHLPVAERAMLETVAAENRGDGCHVIPYVAGSGQGLLLIDNPPLHLVVATLQSFLDDYLANATGASVDYIHGTAAVTALGGRQNCAGFYLPAISKHDLFRTIILDGALPRKTFSMGEADEKRFYVECRRICR